MHANSEVAGPKNSSIGARQDAHGAQTRPLT